MVCAKEEEIEFIWQRPINNHNSLEYLQIPGDTFINITSMIYWTAMYHGPARVGIFEISGQ